jgi:iron(III) transport system permease protein
MQFVDRRIFRMGIVISALLVILAVVFVIAARQYVAIKDYSSLSYSRVERRRLGPVMRWLAVGFLFLLMAICTIPQVGVLFAAVGRGWALTPFPVHYTLEFFRQVSIETPKFIVNSILYSGLALVLCLVIGVPMAWIMSRTRAPGRHAMDALTTLILAIPGTAIGIAYIRAFNFPLPLIDVPLTSMWLILPLVLAVRRLPYTVRGSFSSLLIVHPSMEEAAANVGATKLRTFRDITVPLVWKGIVVGGLFSFIMSIQEASATLFLTLGGWEMIPFGIFTFYIAGSQSQAAALGVILIVLCALSLLAVNRIAGTRVGGLFG